VRSANRNPRTSSEARALRILVAEDNPVNQILAKALLQQRGHEVLVAGDGFEALDLLSRRTVDLVFMDISMPKLDGIETTRRIRAGRVRGVPSDLPIVALTAHALKGDRERFLAAGMDEYVSKPIDPAELTRVIAATSVAAGGPAQ
jgi:two-component system, sensor histidine kinase